MAKFERFEIGGSIFELIEFTLDRRLPDGTMSVGKYGVNVAKVREVVRMPVINPLASSIQGVAGVFELRGIPIPAINLAVALGDKDAKVTSNQQIIVTEFGQKRAGFIVKSTERIRRVAWEKILPPTSDKKACISGMTLIENNEFLFILDFEKILYDIETLGGFHSDHLRHQDSMQNYRLEKETISDFGHGAKILLVDDSNFILSNTKVVLQRMGFDVITASDGQKAKQLIQSMLEHGHFDIDVIVTDVEMPQMDGLTLTKWIKNHADICQIPVVLHTSLSGQANQEAGELVGADDYIIKNDMRSLIDVLSKITEQDKDQKGILSS